MDRRPSYLLLASMTQEAEVADVPTPDQIGLPFEDIYLTTSDGLKLHAYLIPARRRPATLQELQSLSHEGRRARMKKEVDDWVEEMGKEDAVEYIKRRPTVVFFHANAGESTRERYGKRIRSMETDTCRKYGSPTAFSPKVQR